MSFFPFDCCPVPICFVFPSTWRKIQSWAHLCLLITLVIGLTIAVLDIVAIYNKDCWKEECSYCVGEIMTFLCILPLTTYLLRLIGQHDDRMLNVQRDLQEQKRMLSEAYGTFINDMDAMLSKSTENSYGFAEQSFEEKRKDFIKFLEHCEHKFSQVGDGTKAETDKFLTQFKAFLRGWLKIFKECSIDPVKCPNIIVSDGELDDCRTLGDTVDLVLSRLRNHSVQFITTRRLEDAEWKTKADLSRKDLQQKKGPTDGTSEGTLTNRFTSSKSAVWLDNSNRLISFDAEPDVEPGSGILCTWIQCGGGGGFQFCSGTSDFPKSTSCFCMKLSLLSQEHVMIITAFLVSLVVFVLRIVKKDNRHILEVLSGVHIICLLAVLIAFERVDYLLRLERQLKAFEKEKDSVEKTKVQMQDFWAKVHDTTELWLYRTVPRLDLMKEIHGQLEGKRKDDVQALLDGVIPRMARLEQSIGDVHRWMAKGDLDASYKKQIGEKINELVHASGDFVSTFDKALNAGALT